MDTVDSDIIDKNLLENIHVGLPEPSNDGHTSLVKGTYKYYHYGCDKVNDQGWGCGYRTLQTLCSWVRNCINDSVRVPTIHKVQKALVDIEDKPLSFIGSRDWIGCVEVGLVIDQLYDVPCKILHVHKGQLKEYVQVLANHFNEFGSPIMMGGDKDCASKGIIGVHINNDSAYLLEIDPHYIGKARFIEKLQHCQLVKWENVNDFCENSFYNFCLPQLKYKSEN